MSKRGENGLSFPVVGAPGVAGDAAAPYDGRWRVLVADGPLPAAHPGLAGVNVELKLGYLVLRASGMLRLDIPLDVIEDDPSALEMVQLESGPANVADEGPWAAHWFSEVLRQPARLVKICEALPR